MSQSHGGVPYWAVRRRWLRRVLFAWAVLMGDAVP
jgi:hypothetical protein